MSLTNLLPGYDLGNVHGLVSINIAFQRHYAEIAIITIGTPASRAARSFLLKEAFAVIIISRLGLKEYRIR